MIGMSKINHNNTKAIGTMLSIEHRSVYVEQCKIRKTVKFYLKNSYRCVNKFKFCMRINHRCKVCWMKCCSFLDYIMTLGDGLALLSMNGGRFEINRLLFENYAALVADSEEKLCRLVREFSRVWESILRVNVGKSSVMRCSRYRNEGRMHIILNSNPLQEVECLKYLGSQVKANGGCGTHNKWVA